ncbi:TetR/AcrR family transcriptional regulator [Mycetocola spongiae]|uniref:TetR/AcrR family transcriptional regulator n=1 Tax=Mycetocola spongiae TaxID=2859226 RepID=UPI001CF17FE7|nr:TetR/AcrR family transcriptional regulator [Mycetocola spongiae]UCR89365.1 TetR family transcriptional regulator [Mycetocola spongiae]
MHTDSPSASLRRLPRQDRSGKRVELILDTLAELIDEVGYAALTPTLVAKRAGMSGPGIYRYFDGLHAIGQALAARNRERLIAATREHLARPGGDWETSMAEVIGLYAVFFRTEPGFRWMRLGDALDRSLDDNAATNRTVFAAELTEIFSVRFEVSPRADLLRHVEVAVEIADSLTARAFESTPEGDAFYIRECATVIVGYLRDYLARTLPAENPA